MTEYIKREDLMERVGRWQLNTREAIVGMIMSVPSADVVLAQDFRDCRNELCLKCGQYRTKHLGSCNGCRWEGDKQC